jgi:hypothetical protein
MRTARAANGHAAAVLPMSAMNSRLFIRSASSHADPALQSFCDDVSHG